MAISDFFSKMKSGRIFFGRKEPTLVVEFILRDKSYIVEEFDLEFKQDVNYKNIPEGATYGGIITVTINEAPDDWINHWMINPRETNDGEFRFLPNNGKIGESAQMRISFQDAFCISYHTAMNAQGAALLTTLVISPKMISIGGEEFENKRRKN